MTVSAQDHEFMARALRLAQRGLFTTDPNPRVGCVIAADGAEIANGWHARAGDGHAEVFALDAAGARARGATVYVTLEPCAHHGRTPPCADALIAAGVGRVVVGMRDPNPAVAGQGIMRLENAGIVVETGVLEHEARALNPGYLQRMERGRPYVRSKIAASLDGRTALANGRSKWITGDAARLDVQRLRARSTAILTGIATVLADDPSLDMRDARLGDVRQPWRVIVDTRLRLPVTARLLRASGPVRVFCAASDAGARKDLAQAGVLIEELPAAGSGVDLRAVLARLGELECNELLVEAGPTLNGALLAAGLIDELVVYQSADVLGDAARGMFAIGELAEMDRRIRFDLTDLRRVGTDCRFTYRPLSQAQ